MKILLSVLLLLASITIEAQTYMFLPIVEVYDGDTIKTRLTLPSPLDKISVRLLNVDTPELPAKSYSTTGKLGRAKCIQEAELALKTKDFVIDMTTGHTEMKVTNFQYGKFAGRILGNISINGKDIAIALFENQLAVPYFGGKKVKDWCL